MKCHLRKTSYAIAAMIGIQSLVLPMTSAQDDVAIEVLHRDYIDAMADYVRYLRIVNDPTRQDDHPDAREKMRPLDSRLQALKNEIESQGGSVPGVAKLKVEPGTKLTATDIATGKKVTKPVESMTKRADAHAFCIPDYAPQNRKHEIAARLRRSRDAYRTHLDSEPHPDTQEQLVNQLAPWEAKRKQLEREMLMDQVRLAWAEAKEDVTNTGLWVDDLSQILKSRDATKENLDKLAKTDAKAAKLLEHYESIREYLYQVRKMNDGKHPPNAAGLMALRLESEIRKLWEQSGKEFREALAERAFLEQKVFAGFQAELQNGIDVINRRLSSKKAGRENCPNGFQVRSSLSSTDISPLRRQIADFLREKLSISDIQHVPFEKAFSPSKH